MTTRNKQEIAPTLHGDEPPKEQTSLFPATLREWGPGEALLLEKRPPPEFPCVSSMLHVRGGSVSRRGLILLARNLAHLAWGRTSKGTDKLISSHSSGGGPGEALLLEKRPPPAFSMFRLFGREREEGKDSHSRQWRLSMAVFLNRNKRPQAAPIEVAELLSEKPPPSHSSFVLFLRLFGGGPGEGLLYREAPPPEHLASSLHL